MHPGVPDDPVAPGDHRVKQTLSTILWACLVFAVWQLASSLLRPSPEQTWESMTKDAIARSGIALPDGVTVDSSYWSTARRGSDERQSHGIELAVEPGYLPALVAAIERAHPGRRWFEVVDGREATFTDLTTRDLRIGSYLRSESPNGMHWINLRVRPPGFPSSGTDAQTVIVAIDFQMPPLPPSSSSHASAADLTGDEEPTWPRPGS